MKIIVDAMGGDNAPGAPVEAAIKACRDFDVEIVLVGKEEVVKDELKKYGNADKRITVVNADDVITNYEEPAKAVRSKKDASVVVAANMLKNGEGDALLSMGSTGALLASGLLIVGRIKGILRPAIATILPSEKGPVMLMDAGANTNCKSENLVQFALMASLYMKGVMEKENPSVGLLSNGEEEGKGNALAKETYSFLKTAPINFYGNVEGRDVMKGTTDIIVCDGFVGNVVLKTIEGMASVIGKKLKVIFKKNIITMLGALCVGKGITEFKKSMDYREYGGAPLLGTKKPIIKGHGSSDAKAVYNAINQAIKFSKTQITQEISKLVLDREENESEC